MFKIKYQIYIIHLFINFLYSYLFPEDLLKLHTNSVIEFKASIKSECLARLKKVRVFEETSRNISGGNWL